MCRFGFEGRLLPAEDRREVYVTDGLFTFEPVERSKLLLDDAWLVPGLVVNVASSLAFSGSAQGPNLPRRAVYAATKSFLITFTRVLAAELVGSSVQVQVVCPGVVSTEFHSRQGMDLSAVPRMESDLVARASLADLARGVVDEIARSALSAAPVP